MALKLVKMNITELDKLPEPEIVEKVKDLDATINAILGLPAPEPQPVIEEPEFSFYTIGVNEETGDNLGVLYSFGKTDEEFSILLDNYSIPLTYEEFDISTTQYIPKDFRPLNSSERNIRRYMKKEATKVTDMMKNVKDEITDLKFRVDLIVRWNMWLHKVIKEMHGTEYTDKMPSHYIQIQELTYAILSGLDVLRSDIESDVLGKVLSQMKEEDDINHNDVVLLYVREIKPRFNY